MKHKLLLLITLVLVINPTCLPMSVFNKIDTFLGVNTTDIDQSQSTPAISPFFFLPHLGYGCFIGAKSLKSKTLPDFSKVMKDLSFISLLSYGATARYSLLMKDKILSLYQKPLQMAEEELSINNNSTQLQNLAGNSLRQANEILNLISNHSEIKRRGLEAPKGFLLVGPPGTGKTSLVREISKVAGFGFFQQAAPYFFASTYGTGGEKIKKFFKEAKDYAQQYRTKAIIFIDEIDGIGSRTHGHGSQNPEILIALLTELDGFEKNDDIILIGATNNPKGIDPALKRPGRLEKIIEIGLPEAQERLDILNLYLDMTPNQNVNINLWVNATQGWSGADLKWLVNEAGLEAIKRNSLQLDDRHLQIAYTKFLKGKKASNENLLIK